LAARLAGYARYRKILATPTVSAAAIDAALDALRPKLAPSPQSVAPPSPTKNLVLQALAGAEHPLSAAEVAEAIGVSRATAQRYLATLASSGEVTIGLRYGTTGRPEQEFTAAVAKPQRPSR
jgi:response regulator of citrate/malate metabolism